MSLVLLELDDVRTIIGVFSYLSSHGCEKILEQQMILFLSCLDHSIQARPWTAKSRKYGAVVKLGVSVMYGGSFIVKLCLTVMLQDHASN